MPGPISCPTALPFQSDAQRTFVWRMDRFFSIGLPVVLLAALGVQTHRASEWHRMSDEIEAQLQAVRGREGQVVPPGRRLHQAEQCPKSWYDSKWSTERDLLDAVYGQIFGGDAINYKRTSIPKWAEVKASELDSNAKLKKTDVVMDLGCGPGFIARAVRRRVAKVYCWDVNADMNNYARKEHGSALEYGLTPKDQVTKHPLVGLPDNSLDVFFAYAVFIHHDIYAIICYFEELAKKMRMNGRVYFQYIEGEPDASLSGPRLSSHRMSLTAMLRAS